MEVELSSRTRVRTLREALVKAIEDGRRRVGDPLAAVTFVVGSRANGEFARRQLGNHASFIRVDFVTPEQLVTELGTLSLLEAGREPEPGGWLGAWLHVHLFALVEEGVLGDHGPTLLQSGWRGPIESVLRELQAGRVEAGLLRRLAIDAPNNRERLELLATLMDRVEAARATSGFFSRTDVEEAALAVAREGTPRPRQSTQLVVTFGDGLLPPGTQEVLRVWASRRDVTRIALPPLERLPAAPWGLRAAVEGQGVTIEVEASAGDRLGHLKVGLYTETLAACVSDDDGVTAVSTPDEIREMDEVVREVQRAIMDGTALDRIAIALPDAKTAEALEAALRRASIEATWLTGPTLERTACARTLRLALDIAEGDHRVAGWHALLTQPGLMGLPRSGRGQWRALLHGAPRAQGVEAILDHLCAVRQEADNAGDEGRVGAVDSLKNAIESLMGAMEGFPREASLQAHAQSWSGFLEHWWRRGSRDGSQGNTPDLDRVTEALRKWGQGGRDVVMGRRAAAQLFGEALAQSQHLRGGIQRAAVRVAPPMALLGGDFDLVCATGLTEERFPRKAVDNPLLTDEMVAQLQEAGARLVGSEQRQHVERRRFSALVAAAQGRLWLSSPRFMMLERTPRLPSTLLMEALSTLEGRRVRYEDLGELMKPQGSRARPVAQHPDEALGLGEHLLARVVQNPEAVLGVLATRLSTRRLMALHRAIDRLLQDPEALPDPWTGLVSMELVASALARDEALPVGDLVGLLNDPAGHFWSRLMQVGGARDLHGAPLDTSNRGIQREARKIVERLMDDGKGQLSERFEAQWEARLQAMGRRLGVEDGPQREIWRREGLTTRDNLLDALGDPGEVALVALEGAATVAPGIRAEGVRAQLQGTSLVTLQTGKAKTPGSQSDYHVLNTVARAMALRDQGHEVTTLTFIGTDGSRRDDPITKFQGKFDKKVAEAQAMARSGWWPPGTRGTPMALSREAELPKRLNLIERVQAMIGEVTE